MWYHLSKSFIVKDDVSIDQWNPENGYFTGAWLIRWFLLNKSIDIRLKEDPIWRI